MKLLIVLFTLILSVNSFAGKNGAKCIVKIKVKKNSLFSVFGIMYSQILSDAAGDRRLDGKGELDEFNAKLFKIKVIYNNTPSIEACEEIRDVYKEYVTNSDNQPNTEDISSVTYQYKN